MQTLAWEVLVPGKSQRQSWGAKPRGTLLINEGYEGEKRITLPAAVARTLSSKQSSGEIHPSSQEELLALVERLSYDSARARVERLIDRREYTVAEVKRKLQEDGYAAQTINAVVDWACSIGLISNQRFAESFIRSKVYAGWGIARIKRELAQRGIQVDEVPGWPYEFLDPEDEVERAVCLASKRSISGPRAFEKLVRYLYSRGYTTGVAVRAAQNVIDCQNEADLVDF